MEELIYTYVNKFPEFKSIISAKVENGTASNETNCKSFKEELTGYNDENNLLVNTCTAIAKHHQDIINEAKSYQIALCKYINYWIYDTLKLMPKFSHRELLNNFYEKIDKLNFCKPYRNSIDKRTYDELKELYNMYEPYINFKKESSENGNGSCEDAEKFFELYEQYAGKCKPKHNTRFCWELIKIGVDYEHHMTKATKCTDKMKRLTPIGNDILSSVLVRFAVLSLMAFVFLYLFNYISFDSWLRPSVPQAKRKKNKFVYRMHDSQDNSDMDDSRYTLAYQSSLDSQSEYSI
ncbi:PIR protein [Plasmodium vivax]|uniref:VIR protein n=1 Tax=Plasmodium vivax TaxID=5855 RepID=A0A565A5E9_PLAVI|nr:PIR protein [Plasmodium vivax]